MSASRSVCLEGAVSVPDRVLFVSAVSSTLTHENHRDTGSWSQTYRHGLPDDGLAAVKTRGHSGTVVTFRADIDGPARLTPQDLSAFPDIRIEVR